MGADLAHAGVVRSPAPHVPGSVRRSSRRGCHPARRPPGPKPQAVTASPMPMSKAPPEARPISRPRRRTRSQSRGHRHPFSHRRRVEPHQVAVGVSRWTSVRPPLRRPPAAPRGSGPGRSPAPRRTAPTSACPWSVHSERWRALSVDIFDIPSLRLQDRRRQPGRCEDLSQRIGHAGRHVAPAAHHHARPVADQVWRPEWPRRAARPGHSGDAPRARRP